MVNSKFVPQSAYAGREVFIVGGPRKAPQHYPVAKVHLKARFLDEIREVVVEGAALLGLDLGAQNAWSWDNWRSRRCGTRYQ